MRHGNSSALICWKELGSEHWDGNLASSLRIPSSWASHDCFFNGKTVEAGRVGVELGREGGPKVASESG